MLNTLAGAVKSADIRKKILFTLAMLLVFRLGAQIPVPGMNREILAKVFSDDSGLFAIFNLFSGGAFGNFTIFALSITPYITASIIFQLLSSAVPSLERLQNEGTEGKKQLAKYTRYATVLLAIVQAVGITLGLFRNAIIDTDVLSVSLIVVTLTAGTTFLMWLGEQINDKGIGNGISLIIFAGIISRLPSALRELFSKIMNGEMSIVSIVVFAIFCLAVIAGIVAVQQAQRRLPVQYAKKVTGRRIYGGESTHIPLKVNQAGVIPVIFAMAMLQLPLTITYFMDPANPTSQFIAKWISPLGNPGVWIYTGLNMVLIIFFTYFYTSITFNPKQIADNLKSGGGFIPGIRPGSPTEKYIGSVSLRLTFVGAIFLALVSLLPTVISQLSGLSFHFGGTSLLIVVGVALDTMKQLEARMVARNYQGFLS